MILERFMRMMLGFFGSLCRTSYKLQGIRGRVVGAFNAKAQRGERRKDRKGEARYKSNLYFLFLCFAIFASYLCAFALKFFLIWRKRRLSIFG